MLDVGWSCPKCQLVLAPSVAEHRCAPPSAGVTAASPQPPPYTPPTSVATPNHAVTGDTWTTVTTGHLGVYPGVSDEYLTEVFPPRLEIHGGTAA